jgi:hypothetical protein
MILILICTVAKRTGRSGYLCADHGAQSLLRLASVHRKARLEGIFADGAAIELTGSGVDGGFHGLATLIENHSQGQRWEEKGRLPNGVHLAADAQSRASLRRDGGLRRAHTGREAARQSAMCRLVRH